MHFSLCLQLLLVLVLLWTIDAAFFISPSGSRAAITRCKEPRQPGFDRSQASVCHRDRPPPWTSSCLECQLLGMNCATPTDFSFSFQGFCKRGGETDIHSDGWGLAFYQNNGMRAFHDDQPAAESPLAKFLIGYKICTLNMISHIRYATCGAVDLANVHPFTREFCGIKFAFCHNGHVPMFHPGNQLPRLGKYDKEIDEIDHRQIYFPVGTTDSEAMFCAILNALRDKYENGLPSLPELYATLQSLLQEIVDEDREGTILNCLLTCGPHVLWVYSWPGRRPGSNTWNGLHYTVREAPFKSCHLADIDYTVDFSLVTTEEDRVAVVATRPLTDDEEWIELKRGELIVFDEGRPNLSPKQLYQVELEGHGLNSTFVPRQKRLEEDLRRYEFKEEFFVGDSI